jgi:FkbM family methyltransferase
MTRSKAGSMDARATLLETTGFNQLAQGRGGYYLYNTNDALIGLAIKKYGEYSALEAQFLEQLYGPGDIVIEAGANIGAHTVGIAKRVGVGGLVVAFEAQRIIFQSLCANIAINSLENVECNWAAVGAAPGTIVAPELDFNQSYNFGAVSIGKGEHGSRIPCVPLDDYLWLPRLKLVKIDIEGMEAEAIEGARRLIGKFRPFLYVENDRPASSEALMRLISSLDYRMYWHAPAFFNPDNFYAERENLFADMASWNMVCVPRELEVSAEGLAEITDFSEHPFTIAQALRDAQK